MGHFVPVGGNWYMPTDGKFSVNYIAPLLKTYFHVRQVYIKILDRQEWL